MHATQQSDILLLYCNSDCLLISVCYIASIFFLDQETFVRVVLESRILMKLYLSILSPNISGSSTDVTISTKCHLIQFTVSEAMSSFKSHSLLIAALWCYYILPAATRKNTLAFCLSSTLNVSAVFVIHPFMPDSRLLKELVSETSLIFMNPLKTFYISAILHCRPSPGRQGRWLSHSAVVWPHL